MINEDVDWQDIRELQRDIELKQENIDRVQNKLDALVKLLISKNIITGDDAYTHIDSI